MFMGSACMCAWGCACTCGLVSFAGNRLGRELDALAQGSMERVGDSWEVPASLPPVGDKRQRGDVGT